MKKILILSLLLGAFLAVSAQSCTSKKRSVKTDRIIINTHTPTSKVHIITTTPRVITTTPRVITTTPKPRIKIFGLDERNLDNDRYHYEYNHRPPSRDLEKPKTEHKDKPKHKPRKKKTKYDRLTLQIGGAGNYTWGDVDETPTTFNPEMVGGQLQGFFGLKIDPESGRKNPNSFGVWATYGNYSQEALTQLFIDQGLNFSLGDNPTVMGFKEWEVGFLMKNWFRISGGVGLLQFSDYNQDIQYLGYYSATAGFGIKVGKALKWVTNGTVLFGRDFTQYSFRPSTGLVLHFDFFRI